MRILVEFWLAADLTFGKCGAQILLNGSRSSEDIHVSAIPVIDVAPLVVGSTEQAHAVARALGRACRDVGFFYVTGHGVPQALIAGVFESSAALFTGPASVREAASFSGRGD